MLFARTLLFTLILALGACSTLPEAPTSPPQADTSTPAAAPSYQAKTWGDVPNWPGDELDISWKAWLISCKKNGSKLIWQEICKQANELKPINNASIQQFFENNFQPWQLTQPTGDTNGLITGYYEVVLQGSTKAIPNGTPIYGVPDDLITVDLGGIYPELSGRRIRGRLVGKKLEPYWSHAAISVGAMTNAPILAWAENPMDAFLLQIQGSGRVNLPDGSQIRLGYANQNGHPYRAVGRWLANTGEIPLDKVSMPSIMDWAQQNPERLQEMLTSNPSFVFFKVLPSIQGPVGALSVPLTSMHSIAVDTKFIPLGSPVFLSTSRPDTQAPFQRLMHAQDVGGAIRGVVRADLYWGSGLEAGRVAGITKQKGQMWLLWPKNSSLPISQ